MKTWCSQFAEQNCGKIRKSKWNKIIGKFLSVNSMIFDFFFHAREFRQHFFFNTFHVIEYSRFAHVLCNIFIPLFPPLLSFNLFFPYYTPMLLGSAFGHSRHRNWFLPSPHHVYRIYYNNVGCITRHQNRTSYIYIYIKLCAESVYGCARDYVTRFIVCMKLPAVCCLLRYRNWTCSRAISHWILLVELAQ